MNVLLDTHIWLWMMMQPARLGPQTCALLTDSDHSFALSLASVWEVAIKHAAGRLGLPEEPLSYVQSRTRDSGIGLLPIQLEHVCRAALLPKHHADPFDRLLVAQAELEGLVLLTHDHNMRRYGVRVLDPLL